MYVFSYTECIRRSLSGPEFKFPILMNRRMYFQHFGAQIFHGKCLYMCKKCFISFSVVSVRTTSQPPIYLNSTLYTRLFHSLIRIDRFSIGLCSSTTKTCFLLLSMLDQLICLRIFWFFERKSSKLDRCPKSNWFNHATWWPCFVVVVDIIWMFMRI